MFHNSKVYDSTDRLYIFLYKHLANSSSSDVFTKSHRNYSHVDIKDSFHFTENPSQNVIANILSLLIKPLI